MANPLQLSQTLAILIASCNCTYGQLVPTHSLYIFRTFQRGAHCIGMLQCHSNIHLRAVPNCSHKLKRLGCTANTIQLSNSLAVLIINLLLATACMVSWSPLIPCKYSDCFKGAGTALKCCTCCTKLFQQTFDGNGWGAWPTHCNSQRIRPF